MKIPAVAAMFSCLREVCLGFHTLMEIMSKLGSKKVEQSPLNHNERLEFLGDAVIEFITTIHLFFMFTELDEGGLATYRSTMVQNKNLAVLAKVTRNK